MRSRAGAQAPAARDALPSASASARSQLCPPPPPPALVRRVAVVHLRPAAVRRRLLAV